MDKVSFTRAILILVATLPMLTLADNKPKAGLYDIAISIENSSIPLPQNQSNQECISEGEFESGPDAFFDAQQQDCTLVDYTYADGNISMKMDCALPGGGKAKINGTGTYTPTSFNMTNRMKMSISGMEMQMTTTAIGTRIGDC